MEKTAKMLLAVDIGNTNVNIGLFKGLRLLKRGRVYSASAGWRKELSKALKSVSRGPVDSVIVCSVVPHKDKAVLKMLSDIVKVKPLLVGRDMKVPVKNLYTRPSQVGQDRLVNAYAAIKLYGAPVVIIDFGTAVTFDVVSRKAAYAGGVIVPGMEMSLETLSRKAALLPKVSLRKPPSVFGKSTAECMQSGVFYGYAAMCDGMVSRIRDELGYRFKVVATGGNAGQIAKIANCIDRVDSDLTLKGLALIGKSRL